MNDSTPPLAEQQNKSEGKNKYPNGVSIVPATFVGKILLHSYIAPDPRTLLFAFYNASCAFYLYLLLAHIAYVTMRENFRMATFVTSIVMLIGVTLYNFLKFGMNKKLNLNCFSWKQLIRDIFAMLLFIIIMYGGLYKIIPNFLSNASIINYLIYVFLEAILVTELSIALAQLLTHFVRLYEGDKP